MNSYSENYEKSIQQRKSNFAKTLLSTCYGMMALMLMLSAAIIISELLGEESLAEEIYLQHLYFLIYLPIYLLVITLFFLRKSYCKYPLHFIAFVSLFDFPFGTLFGIIHFYYFRFIEFDVKK